MEASMSEDARRWEEDAKKIEAKEQEIKENQYAEAAKWKGEIDVLMDRVERPEEHGLYEDVDMDTGELATLESKHKIATPSRYSRSARDQVNKLIERQDQVALDISDLLNTAADTPDAVAYATHQANMLKEELAAVSRSLYAKLTANPLITEVWLAEHPDSWYPEDLLVLKAYYLRKMGMVIDRVKGFRGERTRRKLGRVPPVDGNK